MTFRILLSAYILVKFSRPVSLFQFLELIYYLYVAHNYFGIDIDIVWATLKKDLPDLKSKIEKIKRLKDNGLIVWVRGPQSRKSGRDQWSNKLENHKNISRQPL